MTDTIIKIVVAFILTSLTILQSWNVKLVASKNKVAEVEKILTDAVYVAEKDGIAQNLSGTVQKSNAVKWAQAQLSKIGFTAYDESVIAAKIETIWANNASTLDAAYASQKKDAVSNEVSDVDAQKVQLQKQQEAIAAQQAKLEQDKAEFEAAKSAASQLFGDVINNVKPATDAPKAADNTTPAAPAQSSAAGQVNQQVAPNPAQPSDVK